MFVFSLILNQKMQSSLWWFQNVAKEEVNTAGLQDWHITELHITKIWVSLQD